MTNKKTNKEILKSKLKNKGLTLGCYNVAIEKISKKEIKKVINGLDYGDSTDVRVKIRRKEYVIEIAYVDEEVDFILLTLAEYIDRYGDEMLEEE